MRTVFVEVGLILVGLTMVAGLYFWGQGKVAEMSGAVAGIMPKTMIKIVGVEVQGDNIASVIVQNIGGSAVSVGDKNNWIVSIKRADGSRVSPSVTSLSISGSLKPDEVLKIGVSSTPLYLDKGPASVMVSGPGGVSASYTINP
ncbi:MAG: hypothetical protein ACP5KE_02270 [Candidatus Methanodesulfokora sp.]|jgi:hypothetical protein|nr:MAG: hypothetical protein C0200_07745 [Candidatus Korarchaeota archaeon]